jgi:hypothetical protein
MHSEFGVLLVIALKHSVWGFCCTNPCEQLSGEIFTHLVPQLGLGDERFLHTILFSAYLLLELQKIAGPYCLGSFQQGRTIPLRRGRSSQSRGALGIPSVGFYLQVLHHHFEGFFEELSSLNLQQQFGTIWRLGGCPTFLYFSDLERSA